MPFPSTHLAGAALVLAVIATFPASAASPSTAADPVLSWQVVVDRIQDGDLAAAKEALSNIPSTSRTERRWRDELDAAITKRASLAQDLVKRAIVEGNRLQLSQAIRKIDLAQQLDRSTEGAAELQQLRSSQVKRNALLDQAQKCLEARASACLHQALEKARALDQGSARAQQLALVAEDWGLDLNSSTTHEGSSHPAGR